MDIIISNSSEVPIYEQVKKAIKKAILEQELKENNILPSIRSLAKDLRISVLTVKKAYDELEQEGYIKTIHGKGSFVNSRNQEMIKEDQIRLIEKHMNEIIHIASNIKMNKQEVIDLFEYLYEEE